MQHPSNSPQEQDGKSVHTITVITTFSDGTADFEVTNGAQINRGENVDYPLAFYRSKIYVARAHYAPLGGAK